MVNVSRTLSVATRDRPMRAAKEEARRLIDKIPEDATWDDIMYEFYVKKKIETALEEAEADEVVSHEEVKKRFLAQ